jgi:hypothetical protein
MAQLVEFMFWLGVAGYIMLGVLFAEAVIKWLDFKPAAYPSLQHRGVMILLVAVVVIVWPWFVLAGLFFCGVDWMRKKGL